MKDNNTELCQLYYTFVKKKKSVYIAMARTRGGRNRQLVRIIRSNQRVNPDKYQLNIWRQLSFKI